jgi:Flp pilus assembly protein TadG
MIMRRHNPFGTVYLENPADRAEGELPSWTPGRRMNQGSRRAAAAVEFAVLLPFMMAMFLGVVDFGRLFYFSMTIDNSLHNAMLFSSQVFDNQNQQWVGNNQYWQGPNGQIVASDTAAAELDGTNLNPQLPTGNVQTTPGTDADGNSVIIVTVTYTFQTLVPYPGVPSPVVIQRTGQIRVAPATPG